METREIIRRLLSGSALRTISLVSSVLVAFFMMPFLVHSLGDEQYGLWVIVGSLIGFYGFFDLGLSTAVGKYTAGAIGKKDYDEVNRITNTALTLFASLGICVIILSFVASGISLIMKEGDTGITFSLLFIIMGTNIGLQFPMRTFSGVLSSQMRFDLLVYVELFKLFTRTAFIVFFISRGHGVVTMALILLCVEITANILEFYLMKKNAPFIAFGKKYIKRNMIKQLALYSWAAFVSNISEMARFKIIPILVASFINLGFVVIYSIALRLLEYFELLMRNCVGFLMPVLSRFDGEHDERLMKKTFKYVTILGTMITIFIGVSIFFYGKHFISLWMGEEYVESYYIMLIMLIPMMFVVMQLPTKDLLFAVSKHKIYAFLSSGSVILLTTLSLVFSQWMDTKAIALAFGIGVGVFELIKPYYIAKVLKEPVLKLYILYGAIISKSILILSAYSLIVFNVNIGSYLDILTLVTGQTILFMMLGYFFILPIQIKHTLQNIVIIPLLRRAHICT